MSSRARLAIALMTVAIAALAFAPAANALSRTHATQLAERAIAGLSRGAPPLAIFGLHAPLASKTVVNEADGAGATFTPTAAIGHREWIYWADPTCDAFFAHTSTLVLIDARTGRVRVARELLWMPMIDGTIAPWLASESAYNSPYYRVASSLACPTAAARKSSSAPAPARTSPFAGVLAEAFSSSAAAPTAHAADTFKPVITPAQLARDCIVMIGDRQGKAGGGEFNPSFAAMSTFAAKLGLAADHIASAPSSITGLQDTINTLVNDTTPACADVFIYLAGHGTPAVGSRIQEGPLFTDLTPQQGGNPGVVVSWKENDAGLTVPDQTITPQDLVDVMDAFETKATFKIKIVSCFSGRFLPYFSGQPNLIDAETSSADDQASWPHLAHAVAKDPATGTFLPPDRFLNGVPQWKNKHLVTNNTDNPDNADEATNGNIHGLEEWASSPTELTETNDNLGAGLHLAATQGLPFNFAYQAGYATPQNYWNPFGHVVQPPAAGPTGPTGPTETTATVGSNLQSLSNVNIEDPEDTDVWQLIFDAAHAAGIPTDSEVTSIMLRGNTVKGPTTIFFQGLEPMANGSVQVMNTTSPFTLPSTAGTYTFTPTNFFVKQGWYIGLSTEGGTDAVAFSAPGASLATFSLNNGVGNGANFTGTPMANTELNAQFTLLEGAEAP